MNIPLVDLKPNYMSIKSEVDKVIQSVIDESAFIKGKQLDVFEKSFASFCGSRYCIGTSNGTSSLYAALRCISVDDCEVITSPFTFYATVEAIIMAGGKPVFVDVDKSTGLLDLDMIEDRINTRTRVLLPVHLYGQMCDMKHLREIANSHSLFIVEDACQAHGSLWGGHPPGFFGDMACFSFFPGKNLGCFGDGGAIVTNNKDCYDWLKSFVDHGRLDKYRHGFDGFNFRLDNLQAGVLNVKLKHLSSWIEKRRFNASYYYNKLGGIVDFIKEVDKAFHSYHLFVVKVDGRDHVKGFLNGVGVGAGVHYPIPCHLQPAYQSVFGCESFPVCESIAGSVLSLPMYPELSKDQMDFVVNSLLSVLKGVV